MAKDVLGEYREWSDFELLAAHLNSPESYEGRVTLQILEYRKHRALEQYNRWLLWLTIILAFSAAGNLVVELINNFK
ncbi:MAG: hypothetical protein HC888_06845 [Candidatus Competibacteraceae bacterium]|nr:hypothetical protein [Candidatus Competibacteraceae bacterium]